MASKHINTPSWREFQDLVARIERTLSKGSIKIASPDRVRSLITGRLREVDASLRTRVGSSEILITIECRRRRAAQDVTWLEQLGCKKQAIGAARTIAVASSAFSSDAVRAASHYGIDLRVLSEITDVDVRAWMLPQAVVHVYKQCDLIESPEIAFAEEPGDGFGHGTPVKNESAVDSAVFVGANDEPLTLNDLWLRADEQLKIFDSIPKDDRVHRRRIVLEPSDNLQLRTTRGLRRVVRVSMHMALRWKHERIALGNARVVNYRPVDPSDPLIPQVRAEFESKEASASNLRFAIQVQPGDSNAALSVELLPGKKGAG